MSNTNENNSAVNFTVENHESGVAIIWFNSPGKVNLLSQAALGELDVIVDRLAADKDCRGVIIASAKSRSYIAGADVNEIGQLQSLSAKASYDLTMNAKGILSKLSNLGVPTLALINGACKGGGLELALWCTFRIAIADGAVVMGLPEVKLGIIPGFGGSVLLPRLIDTVKAVTMIASGSDVTAAEAWKIGLVDEIVPLEGSLDRAIAILLGARVLRAAASKPQGGFAERAVAQLLNVNKGYSPVGWKGFVAKQAQGAPAKQVLAQVKKQAGVYMAPVAAATVAIRTLTMAMQEALEYESAVFSERVTSSQSANLVALRLNSSRAKKLSSTSPAYNVTDLAVIGSGVMGREIAFEALCADAINSVVLVDIKEEFLEKAGAEIGKLMAARVRSGKYTVSEGESKLRKLKTSVSYDAIINCQAIVEAVPEVEAIKFSTYAQIDAVMATRVVATPYFIYSNTSALNLEHLAAHVANPANFCGMHFFNPVSQMGAVEIPAIDSTNAETISTAIAIVNALGKLPIPCTNYPGFIVNAILGASLSMAANLMAMGVSPLAIDKAMLNFGMPMGPCTLMDYVGLDVVSSVAKTLGEAHGARLKVPSLDLVGLLVGQGHLGRKSGEGIYQWKDGKVVKDAKTRKPKLSVAYTLVTTSLEAGLSAAGKTPAKMADQALQELIVGAMQNEALRVLQAGVAAEPFIIDLAFVTCTGFTPALGGPLRYIDQIGVKTFADLSSDIAIGASQPGQEWRANFEPCALLKEHAQSRTNIYPVTE